MNPWILMIECFIAVILLYIVLMLVDSIIVAGIDKSKPWFKRHIGDNFPYPEQCFNCRRQDCVGCEVLNGE